MVCSTGLVVGPQSVAQPGWGDGIFAEIVPAPRLGHRSWREPHIRWWFEILSDQSPGEGDSPFDRAGTHFYRYDGGAMTLSGAVRKAVEAMNRCANDIDDEASR